MSEHELMPAIQLLERKVDDAERKVTELVGALNVLRAEAGMPPRVAGSGGVKEQVQTQIKADTFFGMKQQSAIRQYLDMRRGQGLGPAKPREIYEALAAGGFEYEAKSPDIALVGLRALLRKRTETFVALQNGTYGLVAWYPDRKPRRVASSSDDDTADDEDDADSGTSGDDDEEKAT